MNAIAMHAAYLLAGASVALPLAGAALTAGLRKWLSRTVADLLGITLAALALGVDTLLLYSALQGGFVAWFGNWFPRGSMVVGIGFVVEPIGAGMAVLAALLTLLALIFSWKEVGSGANYFQPLMLVFLAAMSGFVLTSDIFNLFVFFELMSTAAFALCGLKTAEPAPLQGAFNFAVTNTIAAFLVLSGVGILYAMTGALNMAQIGLALGTRHDPLVLFACTLLTCGFLVKGAIVPFHLWLPDAHAVAPTPVCVLFSGLMVELGLFAVMRLQSVVFGETFISHPSALRNILASFAIATVLLGSVMCYAEHHLKRLLAFSTISHAGLMLLAFSMGGATAVAAMLTYLLAHAFIKSSLFFHVGHDAAPLPLNQRKDSVPARARLLVDSGVVVPRRRRTCCGSAVDDVYRRSGSLAPIRTSRLPRRLLAISLRRRDDRCGRLPRRHACVLWLGRRTDHGPGSRCRRAA
jgi:multicomponent Na+:H+ antiporter subunit D